VLSDVRRKRRASEIMRCFCEQLNEATRIRVACSRANKRIRKLQQVCQDFLERKRKWIDQASKTWVHLEEEHLAKYFKLLRTKLMQQGPTGVEAQKFLQAVSSQPSQLHNVHTKVLAISAIGAFGADPASRRAKPGNARGSGMTCDDGEDPLSDAGVDALQSEDHDERGGIASAASRLSSPSSPIRGRTRNTSERPEDVVGLRESTRGSFPTLDWKAYRIPVQDRRFALGRWYCQRLMAHVKRCKLLVEMIWGACKQNNDFQGFLKSLGADQSTIERTMIDFVAETNRPGQICLGTVDVLAFHDEDAMQLIGMCAQNLEDSSPFQEHPANKDLPSVRKMGWPGRRGGNRRRALNDSKSKGGRMVKAGSIQMGDSGDEAGLAQDTDNFTPDVDDLLRRFSPRLRQISRTTGSGGDSSANAAELVLVSAAGLRLLKEQPMFSGQRF